jgi:8-oxo-dGTP pyrophosphatase MutT (NUDIX family)
MKAAKSPSKTPSKSGSKSAAKSSAKSSAGSKSGAEKSKGTAGAKKKPRGDAVARPEAAPKAQAARQVAALPWRRTDQLEIMLVSSRETRRWIIPKGWPMAGRSDSTAAAIEALEEAGLLGAIDEAPFGQFTYSKKPARGKPAPCVVDVFALRVVRQRPRWLEWRERKTMWVPAREAARIVSDPELGALIERFAAQQCA